MNYGQRIKPSSVASVKRRPSLLDKAKSILFSRRNSVSGTTAFGSQGLDGGSQMRRNADGSDDEEVRAFEWIWFLNCHLTNLKFRAPLLSLSILTFSKKGNLFTVSPSCVGDTSRIERANDIRQFLFWFQTDEKCENFLKNWNFFKLGNFGILAISKDWSGLGVYQVHVREVLRDFINVFNSGKF